MDIINDKAALLGAAARKSEIVQVGKAQVMVTEIGAVEYLQLLETFKGDAADRPFIPALVAAAVVDSEGKPFLTEADYADLSRDAQFILGGAAMRLNGMLTADGGEKNSAASQEESSPSGSPSI